MDSITDLFSIFKREKRILTKIINPGDTSEMRRLKEIASSFHNYDEPYFKIKNPNQYTYNFFGLSIFVQRSKEDYEFISKEGTKILIKKGELIGNIHFTPFGISQAYYADRTLMVASIYVSVKDFYDKVKDPIDGIKLNMPTAFYGLTEVRELATFAEKHAGFIVEQESEKEFWVVGNATTVKKKIEESTGSPEYLLKLADRLTKEAAKKESKKDDLNS